MSGLQQPASAAYGNITSLNQEEEEDQEDPDLQEGYAIADDLELDAINEEIGANDA